MAAETQRGDDESGLLSGWIAGGLVVVAIFAVGAYFWFSYHP